MSGDDIYVMLLGVRLVEAAVSLVYHGYSIEDARRDVRGLVAAGVNGSALGTARTSERNEWSRLAGSLGYMALVTISLLGIRHPAWPNFAGTSILMAMQATVIRNSIDSRRNRKRVIAGGA